MTDLEITKACAEAMGYEDITHYSRGIYARDSDGVRIYDPLHDDAQAMALVKKFNLDILHDSPRASFASRVYGRRDGIEYYAVNQDLNRAICECVAKMQEAKRVIQA